MAEPVLHIENLTMQFGGVMAVNDLSMDIYPGEIVALIGPNGAGKTTAFNCVTGVYEPTNGKVEFLGAVIAESHPRGRMKKLYAGEHRGLYTRRVVYPPDAITKLGIARTFQNIRLFKSMSVFENVLTAMHLRRTSNLFTAAFRLNRREEAAQRARALELLQIVGLDEWKDEPAAALPYGKQRRLEIARALATEPRLLLLDEPAAGMNPQETMELTAFIRQIRAQFDLTVFLIEHHMNLVMDISDRIYVIDFGRQNTFTFLRCFRQNGAPGIDDHAVAVGQVLFLLSGLIGCQDIAEVFDGPGAQQGLPMGLARGIGEVGRREDDLCALKRHGSIQLREPNVIADGQAQASQGRVHSDDPGSGMDAVGFPARCPIGQRGVEGVELAILGDDPACRVDEDGGVIGPGVPGYPFKQAAAVDIQAVLPGFVHQYLGGITGNRLPAAALANVFPVQVHDLRETDQPCASRRRLVDITAGHLQVGPLIVLAVHLHDGRHVLSNGFHILTPLPGIIDNGAGRSLYSSSMVAGGLLVRS